MHIVLTRTLDPGIRNCRKEITPGKLNIEIYKSDLYEDAEKVEMAKQGGAKKEECPWIEFLGHGYTDHKITEVTILVPESVAKPKATEKSGR